jgi:enoyl-[acyl-carrier protein] reductase II
MNRSEAEAHLDALWRRGREFLGSRTAIMGGAMTWVSERHLVAAISNGGGFGVIASGTMHPELMGLIDACLAAKVGHVVLAGGLPPGGAIQRLKEGGAKVMCFAPAVALAKKLVRSGADAIIIEGMEAGGHIGPVSTSVLAQEILPAIRDVPVFVAGGIGRGQAMLGYLEMGASGVQLGTRFVCATESIAHARFKQAFIRAAARDAIPSVQLDPRFPVIPVRALVNDGVKKFMEMQRQVIDRFDKGELDMKAAQLEIEHFWAGALRRAVIDGDIDSGSVMAGQSVGMVSKEQPTAEIIQEMVEQAIAALLDRHSQAAVGPGR